MRRARGHAGDEEPGRRVGRAWREGLRAPIRPSIWVFAASAPGPELRGFSSLEPVAKKNRRPASRAVDRAGEREYISPTPVAGPEVSRLCGLVFPTSNLAIRS